MKNFNLIQNISNVDQFRKMLKKGCFPLMLVLDEAEYEFLKCVRENGFYKTRNFGVIDALYTKTSLIEGDDQSYYMELNSDKLFDLMKNEIIRVKNLIDSDGKKNKIRVTYRFKDELEFELKPKLSSKKGASHHIKFRNALNETVSKSRECTNKVLRK